MVNEGSDSSRKSSTVSRGLLSGALAGFSVRILTQPLDVVKIRFQLQVEPIRQTDVSYYRSFAQAVSKIFQEEQWCAFWKGHVAGQMLSIVFTGVEFGTFRYLSAWTKGDGSQFSSLSNDAAVGLVSGATATTCAAPFEVMRTRMVAQGPNKVYPGLLSGVRKLVQSEGAASLWRGLIPSLVQTAPQTSITFTVYEALRRVYVSMAAEPVDAQGIPQYVNLWAGGVSGLVAKTVVYPLDMVKKRLEIRGFEMARRRYGQDPQVYTAASYRLNSLVCSRSGLLPTQLYASIACLFGIVRHEGALALFKGWLPASIKASFSTALTFLFFEQFNWLLSDLL